MSKRTRKILGRPVPLWSGAVSMGLAAAQALGYIDWTGTQMGMVTGAVGALLVLAAGGTDDDETT